MNAQVQTQEQQPAAPFLALPVTPNNTPKVVPNGQADTTTPVVVNDYTKAAHTCAERLIAANQGRIEAFLQYAESIPNFDGLKAARAALVTELTVLGSPRADTEASEWFAFALAYHADKDSVLKVVASDYREKLRNAKGEVLKDSLGNDRMVKLTSAELVKTVRTIRDKAAKEGKIPESVYTPRSAPKAPEVAAKLTSQQIEAFATYCHKAGPDQFGLMLAYMIEGMEAQPNGDALLGHAAKLITAARRKWAEKHPAPTAKPARTLKKKGEGQAAQSAA